MTLPYKHIIFLSLSPTTNSNKTNLTLKTVLGNNDVERQTFLCKPEDALTSEFYDTFQQFNLYLFSPEVGSRVYFNNRLSSL